MVKNLSANAGDLCSIPKSRRSPGEENGNSFQYSCLGNPMNRGAWRAIIQRVQKSQTSLNHWACRCKSGFPWWLRSKEFACHCRRCGFHPWAREDPLKKEMAVHSVFLPEKSHRQRSLVGYSPRGHKRAEHDWGTKQQLVILRYSNVWELLID